MMFINPVKLTRISVWWHSPLTELSPDHLEIEDHFLNASANAMNDIHLKLVIGGLDLHLWHAATLHLWHAVLGRYVSSMAVCSGYNQSLISLLLGQHAWFPVFPQADY